MTREEEDYVRTVTLELLQTTKQWRAHALAAREFLLQMNSCPIEKRGILSHEHIYGLLAKAQEKFLEGEIQETHPVERSVKEPLYFLEIARQYVKGLE